jgi:hypothetical protein
MATKADVAKIALQAARQHQSGDETWTHNGFTFDLAEGGWCARFVMMCYECAMGLEEGSWQFREPSARTMERALRSAGYTTARPQPGDIVGLNNQGYWAGHTAIYLGMVDGVESIAENTSSSNRGNPMREGTKLTPLDDVRHELTAFYAPPLGEEPVAAGYAQGPIKVVLGDEHVDGWLTDHAIVGVRALADMLGYDVADHIPGDRSVVLTKRVTVTP